MLYCRKSVSIKNKLICQAELDKSKVKYCSAMSGSRGNLPPGQTHATTHLEEHKRLRNFIYFFLRVINSYSTHIIQEINHVRRLQAFQ